MQEHEFRSEAMKIEHQITRHVSRGTTAGTVQQSGTPSLSTQASPSKRPAQSTLKASRKTTSKSPNSSPEKNCQKKALVGGKKTQAPSDGSTNPVTSGGNAEATQDKHPGGPKSSLPDPKLSVTSQDSCEKNLHPHFELDTKLEPSIEAVAISLEVPSKTNTSTDTSIATSTEIVHCISAGCIDSSLDTQVVTSTHSPTQTSTMADNDNDDEKIRNESKTMNVTRQSTIHTPSDEDGPNVENILPAVSDEVSDAPLEISTMPRGAIEMQENEPHAKKTKKGNEGFGVTRFLRWQTSFLVLVGLSIPVIWLSADLAGNGPQLPPPT